MSKKLYFWNFIILAILGGVIGLQEFYTKKTILGILAVIFSWTCIPAVVALVEVFVWLFRGEEEFDFTYNK
jgi:TM2 domain-containing membrane protein YozV